MCTTMTPAATERSVPNGEDVGRVRISSCPGPGQQNGGVGAAALPRSTIFKNFAVMDVHTRAQPPDQLHPTCRCVLDQFLNTIKTRNVK